MSRLRPSPRTLRSGPSAPPDEVRVSRDIAYAPAHGIRGCGDLFIPSHGARASVLLIHGGGWNALAKESVEGIALLLASRAGLAVFSVNYRLLDTAPWPACADDCAAALAFLQDRAGGRLPRVATERCALVGASAGAHLALMTALRSAPGQVAAVVSLAGPSSLPAKSPDRGDPLFDAARLGKFYGHSRVTAAEARAASPAWCHARSLPPLLCLHSDADQLVPPFHSHLMVERYHAAGRQARLVEFAGEPPSHGIWQRRPGEPRLLVPAVAGPLLDFLSLHLAPAPVARGLRP